MTAHVVNLVVSGVFHASILFLVSAGLQVVFGVQKIFNLACGSFYALGAYVGLSAGASYAEAGGPAPLLHPLLGLAGRGVGPVRIVVEPPALVLGRGARRGHAAPLREGLHARHGARHPGRRARHPGDGGDERDGHRADRRGLRRRRDRGPRVHAGRPRRRADRRRAPLDRDLRVSGARDAADLPNRHRGAGASAARPLRRGPGVSGPLAPAAAPAAPPLAPPAAPTHPARRVLRVRGYAPPLLGLNLLFGYTGLVSFGHALFLGIGAYTGAFLTSVFKVRSMEVILVAAAALGALVAAPVGALCVRYVKIYFGMLTLAFGMVFYTFVLKFYRLTGGDEGMPFLRPALVGRSLEDLPKTDYLVGPYYYYSLAVLVLATLVMWRIVRSPFGLCLKTIRDNPTKAETLGIGVARYRWCAFVISAGYAAVGGALLGPPTGNVDPTLAYWTQSGNIVFMTLLGGFASFFGPVLGAFVFIYLQDWVMSIVPFWRLIFGAILALIVIFAPGGLAGLWVRRPPVEASPP